MSLGVSRAKLGAISRELSVHWKQTRDYWKDAKCREFEQQYIQGLLSSVDAAIVTIEKLDRLVTKARNDCE